MQDPSDQSLLADHPLTGKLGKQFILLAAEIETRYLCEETLVIDAELHILSTRLQQLILTAMFDLVGLMTF